MKVALIGQPNSGKSAVLARLTGARVVQSNYPGTTVELARGKVPDTGIEVIDTPGIYSLAGTSREQQVTLSVIGRERPQAVLNVIDATNLQRHLSLTLALMDLGLNVVVVANHSDRLSREKMKIDVAQLEARLGVPVILTSALTGEGLSRIVEILREENLHSSKDRPPIHVGVPELARIPEYHRKAREIAEKVMLKSPGDCPSGSLLDNAWVSLLTLIGVGLAIFRFFIWALPFAESTVNVLLNPVRRSLESLIIAVLPSGSLSDTIARAIVEGLTLPLSTVLPAMVTAYTVIGVLEDSGLLSRFAAAFDSVLGVFSLPGQSIVPIMLGFGCRVPGILSARILPSNESRKTLSVVIATLVPCTATTTLVVMTLAKHRASFVIPLCVTLLSALCLSRTMQIVQRSTKDPLVLEVAPLRLPIFRNVLMKTEMRLQGFFSHVLPLLALLNVIIRMAVSVRGGLSLHLAESAGRALGIPPEAVVAVVLSMVQRYLAPLFLMQQVLTPRQAVIAVTMILVGFPCLPSIAVLARDYGVKHVITTLIVSFVMCFGWGAILNVALP